MTNTTKKNVGIAIAIIILLAVSFFSFQDGWESALEHSEQQWNFSGVIPHGKNIVVSVVHTGELVPQEDGLMKPKIGFLLRWDDGFSLIHAEQIADPDWHDQLADAARERSLLRL